MDNPFKLRYVRTQASQWILLNEEQVKRSLAKHLNKVNKIGVSLEDCFVYCLDYFMRENKVFTFHYSDDDEYTIEKYIFGNLKHVVTEYSRLLDELPEDAYLTSGYVDKSQLKKGNVALERDVPQKQEEYLDNIYYNELFESTVGHFKAFLKHKKYMEFDVYPFVYLFFVKPTTDDLQEKMREVSSTLNIPISLIDLIMEDLKDSIHKDVHIDTLFKNLKELIEVNKKFVPKYIKGSDE